MHFALVHSRLLHAGGLEQRLFSYIRVLHERGHDVTVIVYKVDKEVSLPDGVELVQVNLKYAPKEIRPWLFNGALKKIVAKRQFDFVLSLTKTSHQDAVLAPGNHRGFLAAMQKWLKSPSDYIQIHLEDQAFHDTSHVLAASQMMKDELVQYYGVDGKKVSVLYPPVDDKRFHAGLKSRKEELKKKHGFDPEKFSFVFVSVSHKRKGLPLLLEVFTELREQPLELLVAGPQPVKTSLDNVKYLGYVRETEELYAAADLFVLPALYEPFGQVVAEAVMCGTPVLISHMVGAKEILSEKEGRVVSGFAPEDWVAAVRDAVLNVDSFNIAPDFARRKKIRLNDHVDAIAELAEHRCLP